MKVDFSKLTRRVRLLGAMLFVAASSHASARPAAAQHFAWPRPGARSGVNGDPIIDKGSVEAFCSWRGRSCEIASVYTDRSSWDAMTRDSGWLFDNFSGFPGQLVISQGLVPNGRDADIAGCASGDFDQHFRDFGSLMVRKGRGASIVRLGWEFNGTYVSWAAVNTFQWKECFRRAALAIRSTNPAVTLDWTINSHGTPYATCGGSSTNCYPGDDVVDIIGIDNYDGAPSVGTWEDFVRVANNEDGLNWILEFAKSRGKPLSVGEWGVAPGSPYNSHDENQLFVYWMHRWFNQNAEFIAYEAYFNTCASSDVDSNLYRTPGNGCDRQNVAAGRLYQTLWRDRGKLPQPVQ